MAELTPPKPMPNRWLNGEGWIICEDCGGRIGSFDLPVDDEHNIKQFYDKTVRCPNPGDCEEC